jgi:hypothetical protein
MVMGYLLGRARLGLRRRVKAPASGDGLRKSGRSECGMTTAEYAIGTLAACGFAALLVTILRSSEVQALLLGIIRHALSMG